MKKNIGYTNHPNNEINWFSWLLLLLNLGSAYLISQIEEYNLFFLLLLGANMLLALVFYRKINASVLNISRVLLGLLFIYSGFVKGVDPLGTQYRIEDYFFAYGMDWAAPMALILSVILNAFEFSLGLLLLLRIKMKWLSWLAFAMMLVFTLTTLYDALYSPVPDCGCFGDALIITNWQTFYKNLVINALVILVLLRRYDFRKYQNQMLEWGIIGVVVFGFVFFEQYNINNLPIINFRPWKVDNRLLPENPKPVKYFLTYKHKTTGEEKEFLSKDLPWQDSVFMANYQWLSSREEDPNIADMNIFPMLDADGNDVSKELVSDSQNVYLLVVYNLNKFPLQTIAEINQFYTEAENANQRMVLLTSALPDELKLFVNKNELAEMPVYYSDDTALKMAIRSNPGLIVVRTGKILANYHYRNFPEFSQLKKPTL
jgi:uncharacterized membrane protein YphA (DoxX/SURF4 family)